MSRPLQFEKSRQYLIRTDDETLPAAMRVNDPERSPTITVIGKAFWDVGQAPKDQSNRRKRLPEYAVWEIQPVMALHVVQ